MRRFLLVVGLLVAILTAPLRAEVICDKVFTIFGWTLWHCYDTEQGGPGGGGGVLVHGRGTPVWNP